MPDPISGLGSFVATRSIMPAEQTGAASSTEEGAAGTQAPTPTATKKGSKGICGPAAIVGLAVIPLLLRRRR